MQSEYPKTIFLVDLPLETVLFDSVDAFRTDLRRISCLLPLRLSALRRYAHAFSSGVLPTCRVKELGVLGRSLMKLGEIAIGNNLTGVEPTLVVTVVAVRPIAEGAVEVIYKTPVPAFILDSIHDSAMFI